MHDMCAATPLRIGLTDRSQRIPPVFTLIAQPQYPDDTVFEDLPETLIRKCCVGRSCGNAELVKIPVFGKHESGFGYKRVGSDDLYFGPYADPAELVALVNRETFWPVEGGGR
jgi:hypothetical protein